LKIPVGLVDAEVRKEREGQRVVAVERRPNFGAGVTLAAALDRSEVGAEINAPFPDRQDRADRGRNARKVWRSPRFSENWREKFENYLIMYEYLLCWAFRTLRVGAEQGHRRGR
jgi:hypothetical protein